uniref:Uncharacterized protein n=1 Tax=Cucumis melo TaxID=3656 RepID=A0A9I9E9L2_CUCME
MHDFCFTIPYGLILVGGGIFGYLRKGSIASLAGGVGTGLVLILAGYLSLGAFKKKKNSYLALILETGICSCFFKLETLVSRLIRGGIVTFSLAHPELPPEPCLSSLCAQAQNWYCCYTLPPIRSNAHHCPRQSNLVGVKLSKKIKDATKKVAHYFDFSFPPLLSDQAYCFYTYNFDWNFGNMERRHFSREDPEMAVGSTLGEIFLHFRGSFERINLVVRNGVNWSFWKETWLHFLFPSCLPVASFLHNYLDGYLRNLNPKGT